MLQAPLEDARHTGAAKPRLARQWQIDTQLEQNRCDRPVSGYDMDTTGSFQLDLEGAVYLSLLAASCTE